MSELSIREQLEAAMSGGAEAPAVEAPAVVEQATQEDTQKTQDPVEDGAEAAQPSRDEKGKFAKSPEVGDITVQEPAAAAEPEPPVEETIRVPASLPAALKSEFKTLDPKWRDFIAKRDEDVNTFRAQQEEKAKRLNRLDEIIAPHKDAWAVQGLDDHQALGRLVAAEKVLRETPAQGILYLAQTYGVNLQQLVQQSGSQQAQAAPAIDPQLAPLFEKVQSLESQLAQQSQAASQASMSVVQSQINEFASNPANLYFANVSEEMAAMLESGKATSLPDAYEKACWADPEIRQILLKEQISAATAKSNEEAARAKAKAAAQASGSVTGAPTPGAAPLSSGPKPSLREELQAAAAEVGARL